MKIGIVGCDAYKLGSFVPEAEKAIINILMSHDHPVLVSGHSPKGGIDIIAEEVAKDMDIEVDIKIPNHDHWDCANGNSEECYGYKARNEDIAGDSDVLYNITVPSIERCKIHNQPHKYTGGCWVEREARNKYKKSTRIIVLEKSTFSSLLKFIP